MPKNVEIQGGCQVTPIPEPPDLDEPQNAKVFTLIVGPNEIITYKMPRDLCQIVAEELAMDNEELAARRQKEQNDAKADALRQQLMQEGNGQIPPDLLRKQ